VGATPQAGWLLFGVKPVVIAQRILERIALLAQALVNLSRKAIRGGPSLAVGLAALVLYFAPVSEVVILLAGGALAMLAANWRRLRGTPPARCCSR
jgi:chromate transporter